MNKQIVNKHSSRIIFDRIMNENSYRFHLDQVDIKDDLFESYLKDYARGMDSTPYDNDLSLAKRHFNELYKNYFTYRNG
jgi:hypothetical protein